MGIIFLRFLGKQTGGGKNQEENFGGELDWVPERTEEDLTDSELGAAAFRFDVRGFFSTSQFNTPKSISHNFVKPRIYQQYIINSTTLLNQIHQFSLHKL